MSDHDDSAERAPAGGVPPWRQPIEYNEGLEDDDDEGPPEDLPDQKPQPTLYWFKNFDGEYESFDFNIAVPFYGRWGQHRDKILYSLPKGRWVLVFVDLPGTPPPRGARSTVWNFEATPQFAVVFISGNDHPVPDSLRDLSRTLKSNPFAYPDIDKFYDECRARSRRRPSPPKKKEKKKGLKEPTAEEISCWRFYTRFRLDPYTKVSQAEIAERVYGDRRFQGKVSRACAKVKAWLEAGHILDKDEGVPPKPRRASPRPKIYPLPPDHVGPGRSDRRRRTKRRPPEEEE